MTQILRALIDYTAGSFLPPLSRSASANGTAIDMLVYDGTVMAVLDSTAGGAGATMDVKFQDSADGTTGFADIGVAFTQVGNGASQQLALIDIGTVKRWVRAVVTIGGTAAFVSNLSFVGMKKNAP